MGAHNGSDRGVRVHRRYWIGGGVGVAALAGLVVAAGPALACAGVGRSGSAGAGVLPAPESPSGVSSSASPVSSVSSRDGRRVHRWRWTGADGAGGSVTITFDGRTWHATRTHDGAAATPVPNRATSPTTTPAPVPVRVPPAQPAAEPAPPAGDPTPAPALDPPPTAPAPAPAAPSVAAASSGASPPPSVHGDTGQRMASALEAARRYWNAVPDCPQGLDTTLGVPAGAIGEAQIPGCSFGISASGYALDDIDFCKDVVHEYGHLLGKPHSDRGIMAPSLDPHVDMPSCDAAFPGDAGARG